MRGVYTSRMGTNASFVIYLALVSVGIALPGVKYMSQFTLHMS